MSRAIVNCEGYGAKGRSGSDPIRHALEFGFMAPMALVSGASVGQCRALVSVGTVAKPSLAARSSTAGELGRLSVNCDPRTGEGERRVPHDAALQGVLLRLGVLLRGQVPVRWRDTHVVTFSRTRRFTPHESLLTVGTR
jgi:hypothetical protein